MAFRQLACPALLLAAIGAAIPAQANLLTDGSFESGPATTGITPLGPTDLPGWTLNGASPWFWFMSDTGGYGTAEDGTKFINITSPSLSQQFPVTAHELYTVSYYEAERRDYPGSGDSVHTTVTFAAGSATGVTSQVANNFLNNSTALGWQLFTFAFTPDTSTMATLQFALNSGSGYPVIDNVVVTGVPEPASLVLLGLGGTALLVAKRRRKAESR